MFIAVARTIITTGDGVGTYLNHTERRGGTGKSLSQSVISAGSIDIGGICGYGGNANISNCTNSGTVMVENCSNNDGSLGINVGGILGFSSANSTLSQCTHSGTMQVSGCTTGDLQVGGISGYNIGGSSISQCIHSGTVTEENNTVSGTKYLGGIVGHNKGTLTDNDCSQGTPSTPQVGYEDRS